MAIELEGLKTEQDELKRQHDELCATVVALKTLAEERDKKTKSEIQEFKDKIIEDDKRRRPAGNPAESFGDEGEKEFKRFDGRDKLHPLTRAMEDRRCIIRTAMGKDTPRDELKLAFQEACGEAGVLSAFFESKHRGLRIRNVAELEEYAPQTCRKLRYYGEKILANERTTGGGMDTATELASWLPVGWAQTMLEIQRTASVLGNIVPEIQMNTAVYNWPLEGGDVTAYLMAQTTGDTTTGDTDVYPITASKSTVGQVVLTSKKFGVRNTISDEAIEDTILPVIPYLNRKHALAHALALDESMTDGQATGQIDTGLAYGATDSRRSWDGWRYIARAKTAATVDVSTFTSALVAQLRGKMGRYGQNVQDLMFVVSYSGLYQFTKLAECLTVDKYGALASILSGYPGGKAGPNEVGRMFGIPIILVGNTIWEQMTTAGIYDNSDKTCSCMLLVNKNCFAHGVRSPLNVKLLSELYAPWGQVGLMSYSRHAFAETEPGVLNNTVIYGYKLGKA